MLYECMYLAYSIYVIAGENTMDGVVVKVEVMMVEVVMINVEVGRRW